LEHGLLPVVVTGRYTEVVPIFMENCERIAIRDCVFRRLDGNAIFLSGKTRNVKIQRSVFEWIGENAIATWGDTKGWDATNRTQPYHTTVEYNFFRELGIYQKQSSAWAQSKAALTKLRYNIMFNMPRAAINFNDGMGGGDEVIHNLIFNTCRESGDHGPINTWDRQPFLTTLRNNGTTIMPSFSPLMRTIARNFIFANYGASEGVDNDDGSSWYHIHHNVFYDSEGFKMDYGGHDSVYEDNLVISYPATRNGQHCIEFGSFFPGHGHVVRRNKCIVPRGDTPLAFLEQCLLSSPVTVQENLYFVPVNGTAMYECGDVPGVVFSLEDVQNKFDLEIGSNVFSTPSIDAIIRWSRDLLRFKFVDSETDIAVA
jgi:Right handed beta helix region